MKTENDLSFGVTYKELTDKELRQDHRLNDLAGMVKSDNAALFADNQ